MNGIYAEMCENPSEEMIKNERRHSERRVCGAIEYVNLIYFRIIIIIVIILPFASRTTHVVFTVSAKIVHCILLICSSFSLSSSLCMPVCVCAMCVRVYSMFTTCIELCEL